MYVNGNNIITKLGRINLEKKMGVIRIITVGDSITEGARLTDP